jgi:hypothetical protein
VVEYLYVVGIVEVKFGMRLDEAQQWHSFRPHNNAYPATRTTSFHPTF